MQPGISPWEFQESLIRALCAVSEEGAERGRGEERARI